MDVTVIIPTYNRFLLLKQAVESCRNTKCDTEIIVVDDGSDDETWDWLRTQPDLVKIRQSNWGKCWAVNEAFKISKGSYVRFLDSDDLLKNGTIDNQFELAEKHRADLVVSGFSVIDNRQNVIKTVPWINCDDFIAQLLGECDSSHYSAYLFKKTIIEDIPHRPDFAFRDDRLFVLEVALKEPKIVVQNGIAFLHREHKGERLQFNKGFQNAVQNFQHLMLYKKITVNLLTINELTERRILAMTKLLWPLAHWASINNIGYGKEVLNFIYEIDPHFRIPEKGLLGFLYRNLGFTYTEKILKFRRMLIKPWS